MVSDAPRFTKRYKRTDIETKNMGILETVSIGLEGYDIYKTFFSDLAKEKKKSFDMFLVLTAQMKDYSSDPQSLNDRLDKFLSSYQKSTNIRGQSRLVFKNHKFDILSRFSYVEDEVLNEIAEMRLRSVKSATPSEIQSEFLFEPTVSSFNIYEFFEKPLEDKYLQAGFELLEKLKEYCIDNLNVLNPKINALVYSNDLKFINDIRTELKDENIFDSTNIEKVSGIQVTNLDTAKMRNLIIKINSNLYFTKRIKYTIKESI